MVQTPEFPQSGLPPCGKVLHIDAARCVPAAVALGEAHAVSPVRMPVGGYAYTLGGEVLKKCRSMTFLMSLNETTSAQIHDLILCEAKER